MTKPAAPAALDQVLETLETAQTETPADAVPSRRLSTWQSLAESGPLPLVAEDELED